MFGLRGDWRRGIDDRSCQTGLILRHGDPAFDQWRISSRSGQGNAKTPDRRRAACMGAPAQSPVPRAQVPAAAYCRRIHSGFLLRGASAGSRGRRRGPRGRASALEGRRQDIQTAKPRDSGRQDCERRPFPSPHSRAAQTTGHRNYVPPLRNTERGTGGEADAKGDDRFRLTAPSPRVTSPAPPAQTHT